MFLTNSVCYRELTIKKIKEIQMKKSHLIGASCAAALSLISMSSYAATLNIQENGAGTADDILLGVNDLIVGGTTYNVTFRDTTCAAVYNGCVTGNLDFTNIDDAKAANVALFNAIDNTYFDTRPGQVGNLSNTNYLTLMIPYEVFIPTWDSESLRSRYIAMNVRSNGSGEAQYQSGEDALIDWDGTNFRTFADFQVTTVPVPAAVWLFGSGLIGLAGIARRKKS